ncbi:hypothetical protein ACIGEZ_29295 [Streptomyces sp. NPDC085481]|uniref:hypothetical protein n=1 Tax=Streptomyces sp. NPDC085481 TaxID=3365727 RepID=UPI0037D27812
MSTGAILAIVIPVAVVIALIVLAVALNRRRRQRLREQFGPEYDRTVDDAGSRRAAEYDLASREQRHESLDIKPLSSGARERYAREWRGVQEEFVDRPDGAVHDADRLVTALMQERGYPTEDSEQRMRDLSVEHGRTLEHYRAAHEINALSSTPKQATTEQLRGAMVHYRALFDELLSNGNQAGPGRT